jgi:8-oxo-dGTP diphosphatase
VDLRTVLFTVAGPQLLVAVRPGTPLASLPRAVPVASESLDAAARRAIREAAGFVEQYSEQLYTLSVAEPDGAWTVVVSYLALICSGASPKAAGGVDWLPASGVASVSATDAMVIEYALFRLRAKLGYTNIAFHLMPQRFTLTELQHVYETILGQQLDKRNFRRRMIASGILTPTADKRRDGSHRPAALYRFAAEHDASSYLTPPWAGARDGDSSA